MKHNVKIKDAVTKDEKNLINLINGAKKPKTERDKRLAADIEKIKQRGGIVEIPHD
jgi:uncharacterized protein YifE (UPF0438 family)